MPDGIVVSACGGMVASWERIRADLLENPGQNQAVFQGILVGVSRFVSSHSLAVRISPAVTGKLLAYHSINR